jgi:post-segregation antitoxin (ccd killing protein)
MKGDVLSLRISKELKEEAAKRGLNIRKLVEKTLEEELKRLKENQLESAVNWIVENNKEVSTEEWVKAVRKTRNTM